MIRVLFMIAIAGFVLSVGTLAAAVAIGGPEAIARGGWIVAGQDWRGDWEWDWHDGDEPTTTATGPQATRTLSWTGADSLDIDLNADVRYVQAAGPASVVVTGPQALIDRVVVRGDSIRYDRGYGTNRRKLSIVVRAPNVASFDLSGGSRLAIENYDQPRLKLDVSGASDVSAVGRADVVELDISGSGDVDLGGVNAKGAKVDATGAADVVIAPTEWAKLDISGAGDVRLLTNPPRLETDLSGAGKVRQSGPAAAPQAPTSTVPGDKL